MLRGSRWRRSGWRETSQRNGKDAGEGERSVRGLFPLYIYTVAHQGSFFHQPVVGHVSLAMKFRSNISDLSSNLRSHLRSHRFSQTTSLICDLLSGRIRPPTRRRPERHSKDSSKLLLLYDHHILDNDPQRESKDTAFAQAYLTRVGTNQNTCLPVGTHQNTCLPVRTNQNNIADGLLACYMLIVSAFTIDIVSRL